MTTSKEVIKYLEKNLDKKNILSMFIAGSIPLELIPGSDIDIFIVAKDKKEQKLLDNISSSMNQFKKVNNQITYTFYRGPIKYKHKGLVHILFYTEKESNKKMRYAYTSENTPVIKSHLKNAKIIYGKSIREIIKDIKLTNELYADANKRWTNKYKILLKKNRIKHPCWKKKNNRWIMEYHRKSPSKYLREYLIKYYKKHLSK